MRWVVAAVVAVLSLPAAALPERPPLRPGRLVGGIHTFAMPAGKSLDLVAASYGVHPVRILKPSQQALRNGVRVGTLLTVDQRRIEPYFEPQTSGIVVNLPEAHLYLVDKGRVLKTYPVGVTQGTWQAPLGAFKVIEKQAHPIWYVPESIQKEMQDNGREVIKKMDAGPLNPLGTRWIGFSRGQVGIHGTLSPTSIKRYASHGCIRMINAQVEDLYTRVKVGTPVHILYQPVMLAVDGESVWVSVYPDVYELHASLRPMTEALLREAGALNKVDWKAMERQLVLRDGIPRDVGRHVLRSPRVSPSPLPLTSPSPTPLPAPSVITPRPVPSTVTPSPSLATPVPAPVPSAVESAAPEATPAPTPLPTDLPEPDGPL